jgi:16S rRNA (adenine(1408)-N(1))-methyltransferase
MRDARHERVIVDLGTGGGGAVLTAARRDPSALVIGVDTNAAQMREASRRAAASPRRGGVPNAIFLAGALAELPPLLDGRIDELRVTLPWGSLLRDVVLAGPSFVSHAVRLLSRGGRVRVLLSITEREKATGLGTIDVAGVGRLAARYGDGLVLDEAREATEADVVDLGSAWAKRLGIPRRRGAVVVGLRKRDAPSRNRCGG